MPSPVTSLPLQSPASTTAPLVARMPARVLPVRLLFSIRALPPLTSMPTVLFVIDEVLPFTVADASAPSTNTPSVQALIAVLPETSITTVFDMEVVASTSTPISVPETFAPLRSAAKLAPAPPKFSSS